MRNIILLAFIITLQFSLILTFPFDDYDEESVRSGRNFLRSKRQNSDNNTKTNVGLANTSVSPMIKQDQGTTQSEMDKTKASVAKVPPSDTATKEQQAELDKLKANLPKRLPNSTPANREFNRELDIVWDAKKVDDFYERKRKLDDYKNKVDATNDSIERRLSRINDEINRTGISPSRKEGLNRLKNILENAKEDTLDTKRNELGIVVKLYPTIGLEDHRKQQKEPPAQVVTPSTPIYTPRPIATAATAAINYTKSHEEILKKLSELLKDKNIRVSEKDPMIFVQALINENVQGGNVNDFLDSLINNKQNWDKLKILLNKLNKHYKDDDDDYYYDDDDEYDYDCDYDWKGLFCGFHSLFG